MCNLKCIMCPTGQGNVEKQGCISLDLYRKIIDEAAAFAIDVNLFGRGEACLHPKLAELVKYAVNKGLNTRLETNATILTSKKSEEVIRAGLDFMSFSFDGYTKETYECIRRGANFERTLDNITQFLKIKRRLRARKPFVSIQFIETPAFLKGSSWENESEFKNRFKNLPLDTYRYVTPHRYAGEIAEDVTGTKYGYMKKNAHNTIFAKLQYIPCPYPWFSMHILWDGTVTPCCMDFHAGYSLGNINDSTLLEIWNGKAMQQLRRKLSSGVIKEIPLCSRCDLLFQTTFLGVSTKNIRDLKIFVRENLLRQ